MHRLGLFLPFLLGSRCQEREQVPRERQGRVKKNRLEREKSSLVAVG